MMKTRWGHDYGMFRVSGAGMKHSISPFSRDLTMGQ